MRQRIVYAITRWMDHIFILDDWYAGQGLLASKKILTSSMKTRKFVYVNCFSLSHTDSDKFKASKSRGSTCTPRSCDQPTLALDALSDSSCSSRSLTISWTHSHGTTHTSRTYLKMYTVFRKNTHSHFLSYLHEWQEDLNKNCIEYTQGKVDSEDVEIIYSLQPMT